MTVIKLMVDGRNVETFQRATVPESGSIVQTNSGAYEIEKETMRRTEPFGVWGHEMPVAYLEARRPIAPSAPRPPKAPARPTVNSGLPRTFSVKPVADIVLMIRPGNCDCGKPHGKVDGDFAVVLLDRGILCDDCATDRAPVLARMLDRYETYQDFGEQGSIEIHVRQKTSSENIVIELRQMADAIQLRDCKQKVAA